MLFLKIRIPVRVGLGSVVACHGHLGLHLVEVAEVHVILDLGFVGGDDLFVVQLVPVEDFTLLPPIVGLDSLAFPSGHSQSLRWLENKQYTFKHKFFFSFF